MHLTCDFERNESAPARLTTLIYRGGRRALLRKSWSLPLWKVADLIWTRAIVGAELPFTFRAGAGLRLPHWGRGIIIGRQAVVGENVTIYHRVTLGRGSVDKDPTVGDRVSIGSGAAILGDCHVGDKVQVGSNSVVTKDVPAGATVVGANRILDGTITHR